MFVLRSSYRLLEQRLDLQSRASAKCIDLLHDRINELTSQIKDLRQLVFPPQTQGKISKEALEIDNVMSVSEKPPEMTEEERTALVEGARELDRIMSGNYDEAMQ